MTATIATGARRTQRDVLVVTEAAIVRLLDDPTTCPHGNPIPGTDYVVPDTVTLSELKVGDRSRA